MGQTIAVLQKAIFETLQTDASLLALIGTNKIFSQITSKTEFPYVIISNWQTQDWSTSSDNGEQHQFDIEVWDDQPSTLRRQNIGSKIIELLHEQQLELNFGFLVNLRLESSVLHVQNGKKIQPLNLKFRAAIEF